MLQVPNFGAARSRSMSTISTTGSHPSLSLSRSRNFIHSRPNLLDDSFTSFNLSSTHEFVRSPPQEPVVAIKVPDHLTFDQLGPCPTCFWSGQWIELMERRNTSGSWWSLSREKAKESADRGRICCAIILALSEIFRPMDDEIRMARRSFYGLHPPDDYVLDWEFFLPIASNHELPGVPRHPSPSGDTGSDSAVSWAKQQIDRCFFTHSICEQASSFLPTRLVDLNDWNSGYVLLRCGREIPPGSHYAALSHCWGARELECLTLKRNMKGQSRRITLATLPLTFREAMQFTRRLGLRYIWLDTLCIIQDDPNDWANEAGTMFNVYSNAIVTLAAAASQDSYGGLFRKRHIWDHFPLVRINHGEKTHDIYAKRPSREFSAHPNWSGTENDRLFTRGWVFQERLISPRVIVFGREGLMWECFQEQSCECASHAPNLASGAGSELKNIYHNALLSGNTKVLWRDLVTIYSGLKLTRSSDRLPAIGGIAKQIATVRKGEQYLAGIWSGTLLGDLLWQLSEPPAKRCRSKDWLAPTWSWASSMERVVFEETGDVIQDPDLTITGCSSNGDPFGASQQGHLKLRGLLIDCEWTAGLGNAELLIPDESEVEIRFLPDFPFQSGGAASHRGKRRVYLLRLGSVEAKDATGEQSVLCNVCMVLRRVVGLEKETYERVGLIPRKDKCLAINDPTAEHQTWQILPPLFAKFGRIRACAIV